MLKINKKVYIEVIKLNKNAHTINIIEKDRKLWTLFLKNKK